MYSDSCANDQFGSIGELCPGADDGSCKGIINTRRKWHPLHPETHEELNASFKNGKIDTAVDKDCPVPLGQLPAYSKAEIESVQSAR